MMTRILGLSLAALVCATQAFADNALTSAATQTRLSSEQQFQDCAHTVVEPPTTPINLNNPVVYISYCSVVGAGGWPEASDVQTYQHFVKVDAVVAPLTSVTCQQGVTPPYSCIGELPAVSRQGLAATGTHTIRVQVKFAPGTPDEVMGEPSAPLQLSQPSGCVYAAPGSTVTSMRPRYQDDPVNGSIQGFNPIAGQGARIAQLKAWGWKVEWQFVDGSIRADKIDRLFLIVFCDPDVTQGTAN